MTNEQFDKLFNQAKELMNKSKDPVHDWRHIERVLINIEKILELLPEEKKRDLDMKILRLAAAWHDISFVFYKSGFRQYFLDHVRGSKIAKQYFEQYGLGIKEIDLIGDIIYHHNLTEFGILNRKRSLYYQIVQDADIMDSYNCPERVELAGEQVKQTPSLWYKFVIKVLKPLFLNWLVNHPKRIYNLPESIKIVKGK